jgi:hypothetical protein
MNTPQIQAEITKCKTKSSAWELIQSHSKEIRPRLIDHAETVFKLKGRQKKIPVAKI